MDSDGLKLCNVFLFRNDQSELGSPCDRLGEEVSRRQTDVPASHKHPNCTLCCTVLYCTHGSCPTIEMQIGVSNRRSVFHLLVHLNSWVARLWMALFFRWVGFTHLGPLLVRPRLEIFSSRIIFICQHSLPSQPVSEPGHVAVAVEGVGDQIEALETGQLVEGPRRDAADDVPVEGETLQVVEAPENITK